MATHRVSILGPNTMPDTSGNVFFEPSGIKRTNDLYNELIVVFKDSGTKISLRGAFVVPVNYVGTPVVRIVWAANNTVANSEAVWDFDYRAIAVAETVDPTTHQESVTVTTTCSTTVWNRNDSTVSLTAGNLAAGDYVEFLLSRDGADASDDLAQDVQLLGAFFEYVDV